MTLYTCAMCLGEFESEWTEADAVAECKSVFGVDPGIENCVKVCDDCFQSIKPPTAMQTYLAACKALQEAGEPINPVVREERDADGFYVGYDAAGRPRYWSAVSAYELAKKEQDD